MEKQQQHFSFGNWSQCLILGHDDVPCGTSFRKGLQTRLVSLCDDDDGSQCLAHQNQTKKCTVAIKADKQCPEWHVEEWSECSTLCGPGNRTRNVTCPANETLCSWLSVKPATEGYCNEGPCFSWWVEAWGSCSVSDCVASQTRRVECVNLLTEEVAWSESDCFAVEAKKPIFWRLCEAVGGARRDALPQSICGHFRHTMCATHRLRKHCCSTCHITLEGQIN